MQKLELVVSWRKSLRMWSMRVNLVASAIVGFVIANPGYFFQIAAYVPSDLRLPAGIAVALVMFFLVGLSRLVKQKKLEEDC